jgi:xanthine dehydrogenase accessory factor
LHGAELFLNVHLPAPRLVLIGAVHISQALAPMAALAGYPVEIIDPRTAFATEARFGGVELHAEWPEVSLAQRPLDAYTALVALTHDPKIDDDALVAALAAGCFYVGALGSRKTHARRLERLAGRGATSEHLARIDAPVGLDIGAANPPEIAVAVLGAVVKAFRSRGDSK